MNSPHRSHETRCIIFPAFAAALAALCLSANLTLAQENPFAQAVATNPPPPGAVAADTTPLNPFAKAVLDNYVGRFTSPEVQLRLKQEGAGLAGTLRFNNQSFTVQAQSKTGAVEGEFTDGKESWPFQISITGQEMTFTTGAHSSQLRRQPLNALQGTFRSDRVTVRIAGGAVQSSGVIQFGGKDYPFTATLSADLLEGKFSDGQASYDFTIRSEPAGLFFESGPFAETLPSGGLKLMAPMGELPAGLAVELAGQPLALVQGEARVAVGKQTLTLKHPDYETWTDEIEIADQKTTEVRPLLKPKMARLAVTVSPKVDFTVWESGRQVVDLDGTYLVPSSKSVALEVRATGYRTARTNLTLAPKSAFAWAVSLEKATTALQLTVGSLGQTWSNDAMTNLEVRLDGEKAAWTNGRMEGLSEGEHKLEVRHPDYEVWNGTVSLKEQVTNITAVEMKPLPGVLRIAITPNSPFTLKMDGQAMGFSNEWRLPAGKPLSLELQAAGFETERTTLTVPPNGSTNWTVTLAIARPVSGQPWENSLGMKFAPVSGTEVLFGIWDVRVQDYRAYAASNRGVDGSWKNPGFTQGDTHPVVKVSWDDAKAFCQWLTEKDRRDGKISQQQSYRLPTDAEWSVAVGNTKYPWGDGWPPPNGAGNYPKKLGVDDFDYTSPVGSFAANRIGLFDMGGNVSQWCEDTSHSIYRVVRGSSWWSKVIFSDGSQLESSNHLEGGITPRTLS